MQHPEPIDRLAPSMEPDRQVLLYQDWHHLLFLHWEIPPQALQALLPPGLDLDTFDGKAYVGLIPFTITGVRPVGLPPLPWVSSFHEVNVRTYVHRAGTDPGVWFFSLDASSVLAVAAARAMYKLPYFGAAIDFAASEEPLPTIGFTAHRDGQGDPAHVRVQYKPVEGAVRPASPGTLEHFLVERYILYATDAEKNLYRARVHHDPYPLQKAEVSGLEETLVWTAGIKRGEEAPIRHYSSGVHVKIYGLDDLRDEG